MAGSARMPLERATASTQVICNRRTMAIKKKAYQPMSWATWPISSMA